jgi:hypothetical protein
MSRLQEDRYQGRVRARSRWYQGHGLQAVQRLVQEREVSTGHTYMRLSRSGSLFFHLSLWNTTISGRL